MKKDYVFIFALMTICVVCGILLKTQNLIGNKAECKSVSLSTEELPKIDIIIKNNKLQWSYGEYNTQINGEKNIQKVSSYIDIIKNLKIQKVTKGDVITFKEVDKKGATFSLMEIIPKKEGGSENLKALKLINNTYKIEDDNGYHIYSLYGKWDEDYHIQFIFEVKVE